jgi:hypothetical protein
MPEKQKARSWKEIQTVIAAASMVMLITLCNIIASFERREDDEQVNSLAILMPTPTPPTGTVLEDPNVTATPTPVVTSTGSS